MSTAEPIVATEVAAVAEDVAVVAEAAAAEPAAAVAQVEKVEVELKNVEAKAVEAEEADDTNQLSKRAVSKRQQARASGMLKATHVKGQYIRNPNYKSACCGISKMDWMIVSGLFLFAYCFNCAFFVALLELRKSVGNPVLYVYFGLFLIFLLGVGFMVLTGVQERAEEKRVAKKEAAEAKNAETV